MSRSCLLAGIALLIGASSLRGAAGPTAAWLRPASSVPNGRQIVGRDDGRYWAIVPDWQRGSLELHALRQATATGEFAVEGRIRLGTFDPAQTQAAMVVDRQGLWHWASSDGKTLRYQASPADRVAECLSRSTALPPAEEPWTVDRASLGDMLLAAAGETPCLGMVRSEGDDRVIALRWKTGGVWRQADLARGQGLRPPVIDAAGDELCLSWSDAGGRIWFQRVPWQELGKRPPAAPQEIGRPGRKPSILCAGGKVFVAYEEWWNQITTCVFDGRGWQTFPVTAPEPRLTVDASHSPHLTLDVHGVPWLFFSDANRRYVFYARWLGERWSAVAEGRGIFQRAPYYDGSLLPADWLSVEKRPAAQVGMVLANASGGLAAFESLPVVMPKASPGRRVLFLDMLEVARLEGLTRVFVPAAKDQANPVFTPSPDAKAFDRLRVFNHGSVLYEGGRFRMWYTGMGLFADSVPWWHQLKIGYAESVDGRRFDRVELPAGNGLGAGSGDVQPPLPFVVALFRDDEESDPQRRYKLIDFSNAGLQTELAAAGQYDLESQFVPGFLYTSPDGLRWTREPAQIDFPGGRPLSFVPQCLLKDPDDPDPQRRWKAYGFMSLTYRRRAGGLAYSPDARHWIGHPRNPVLDPQVSRMPIVPAGRMSQIHDTVVWRDAGLYLCLFQDQRSVESLPLELAVSRDGEHFVCVEPGTPLITEGGPDDWDSLELLPSPPVERGDELWFYYGGAARGHDKPDEGRRTSAGLARARKDGFTCLELAPGRAEGSLITVPFEPSGPFGLFVNAACKDGTIRAELLGADGGPLDGYASDECRAITGDHVRIPVRWSAGEEVRTQSPFRIRFCLAGRDVRMFSFGFGPLSP